MLRLSCAKAEPFRGHAVLGLGHTSAGPSSSPVYTARGAGWLLLLQGLWDAGASESSAELLHVSSATWFTLRGELVR